MVPSETGSTLKGVNWCRIIFDKVTACESELILLKFDKQSSLGVLQME